MTNFFVSLLAFLVTVPIITWPFLYVVTMMITKNKRRAFQVSTDMSTLFAIIAVHLLIYEIWHVSLLWLLILLVLLSAVVFTWLFWKMGHEMNVYKILRGTWRFNFLLFMFSYLILFLYGIVDGLVNT